MTIKEFIISAAIGVISTTIPNILGFKIDSFQYWFITLYTIFVCAVLRIHIESKPNKSVKKKEKPVIIFGESNSGKGLTVINIMKTSTGKIEIFDYDELRLDNYRDIQKCTKNTEIFIINGFASWRQVNVFSEAFIPSIAVCKKCEESFILPVKFVLVCQISEIDSRTFRVLSKKFDIIYCA